MMTNENRPGVEVPEPDWTEQLIDAREPEGFNNEDVDSVPGSNVIREADAGDIAEQGVIVEIDDEDGYDDSASI